VCIWKQVRGLHEEVQSIDFGFSLTSKYEELKASWGATNGFY
jgi:hypothetical protein